MLCLTLCDLSAEHGVLGKTETGTEIVSPFPLVSEPTASDRKTGSAAAAR